MKNGFTLSEVLITLGVIGVIAAMTLPTVIKNYQKKVTVERLKATYSMLYQAIRRSEVDNGTLDTWEFPAESTAYEPSKTFAIKYFTPYLKNVKEIKRKNYSNSVYRYIDGAKADNYAELYSLILSNGVVISFYPRGFLISITIDINGSKSPNIIGKDIFPLILTKGSINNVYFGIQNKPGLYFFGQGQSIEYLKNEMYACSKTKGTNARGSFCGALIMQNNWQMPDDYPW